MMDERLPVGWGGRFLKLLVILLIAAGIFLLVRIVISRIPPDLEEHRSQLEFLERAYEGRRTALVQRTEQRVKNAPNEVLAIQYQQELNLGLTRLERRYFADRQAIIEGDDRGMEENWAEEINSITEGGEDEASPPPER